MKLRNYRAPTMAMALLQVKRDLGTSAVILHTRTYKQGGVFGLGAKTIVEITAADRQQISRRGGERSTPRSTRKTLAVVTPTNETAGDLIKRTYATAKAELGSQQLSSQATQTHQDSQAQTAPVGVYGKQLVEEMQSVKWLVHQMMRQKDSQGQGQKNISGPSVPSKPDLPEKLFDQYLHLLKQEVTEELADEVVQAVRENLGPTEIEDESTVRQAVMEVIANLIPVSEQETSIGHNGNGVPHTIVLVGPTGVGKTTTIAKLAATFKLKQGKNIGLITLDTYRIAAVEQLRTYANIIGVPLYVSSNSEELIEARQKCAGCDCILIDTAGRSQHDDPRLEQLKNQIEIAKPDEVHLVLSSTCSQSVLFDVVERFSTIRTNKIIFTKLDEAVSFGVLLNVARKVNKQLSYFTTGQEVPHHIEPGCPSRLAGLVLGDEVKPCC